MPSVRNEALVKPEILVWARESAGLGLNEAAKKIPVKPEQLLACEQGKARLTVAQLRTLSNAYKRPLAFFFLPAPPQGEKSLHDYRKLPDQSDDKTSPALRFEIRKANYRREVALDLYKEMGLDLLFFSSRISLDDDTEKVGENLRRLLDVTLEEQIALKTGYEALAFWRDKIEQQGIFVFQAPVPLNEMRGFSIWYSPLPIIVVNSKDFPFGRVFTMLHELTHLMLRATGLCLLRDEDKTETFCNAVAGAALVPAKNLLQETAVVGNKSGSEWDERTIKTLSGRYSVSREVILRRLLTLGHTSSTFYQLKTMQWKKEYERLPNNEKVPIPIHTKVISGAGKPYVRLIIDSYRGNKITLSDVSRYLGVKVEHFSNIETAISNP